MKEDEKTDVVIDSTGTEILNGKYTLEQLKAMKGVRSNEMAIAAQIYVDTMKFKELIKESPFVTNREVIRFSKLKFPVNHDEIYISQYSTYDKVYISTELLHYTNIKYVYSLINKMKPYSNVVCLKSMGTDVRNTLIQMKLIAPTNIEDVFIVNHHEVFVGDNIDIFNCIYYTLYAQKAVNYDDNGNINIGEYKPIIVFINDKKFYVEMSNNLMKGISYDETNAYNNISLNLQLMKLLNLNK